MNQERTPIYSALQHYAKQHAMRLHMPGHVGGRGMDSDLMKAIAALDVTEIPGLDDLHLAEGVIRDSSSYLAEAFGADESFMLVNGASSGIHAMCMAVKQGKVLISRNVHRSFFAGMVFAGIDPVYVPCEMEPQLGIATGVSVDAVKSLLKTRSDVQGVFVTSPSYYGSCCDLQGISNLTQAKNIPLLVDEAHGGHFAFHPGYPRTALEQGSDSVVNGLHKTLPVFNQGAVLHVQGDIMNKGLLRKSISLLTTTSPSYLIMASIELARSKMEEEGRGLLERAKDCSMIYEEKINQLKGFQCLTTTLRNMPGVIDMDPLKMGIAVDHLGLTGDQVAELLRTKYKIQVEFSTSASFLAMFSMFHEPEEWKRFFQALQEISTKYYSDRAHREPIMLLPAPTVVLSPREAFFAPKRRVHLSETVGLLAGEMVAAYPPGIPCLLPGELITGEIVDYLYDLRANCAHIHGPADLSLGSIEIID